MGVVKNVKFKRDTNVAEEIVKLISDNPGINILIACTNVYQATNEAATLIRNVVDLANGKSIGCSHFHRYDIRTYAKFANGSTINANSVRSGYLNFEDFDYFINLYCELNGRWPLSKNKILDLEKMVFSPDEDTVFF